MLFLFLAFDSPIDCMAFLLEGNHFGNIPDEHLLVGTNIWQNLFSILFLATPGKPGNLRTPRWEANSGLVQEQGGRRGSIARRRGNNEKKQEASPAFSRRPCMFFFGSTLQEQFPAFERAAVLPDLIKVDAALAFR